MGIAVSSVAPLAFLTAMLVALELFYTRYRDDHRIAASCGILAVLIVASLMTAINSHVSLRFAFPFVDQALSTADRRMGVFAPDIVLKFAEYPAFSQLLWVLYEGAMPLCIVCALFLSATGRKAAAYEFAFCFAFCILAASACSIFFPALGSTVYHGIEGIKGLPTAAGNFHLPTVEYFQNDPSAKFDLTKVSGVLTFPSFHMVMALLIPYAFRKTRIMFWIAIVWALLVTLSTVVIGGHYIVDLLGGAVTWAAAAWLAKPDRRLRWNADWYSKSIAG
jgi:membrane-associated phospholipid phosphatase